MKLCIDYLRDIESQTAWSRFRIAKEVGLSSARMYQLFDDGGTYNDETAIKVAALLKLDPAMVMAAANAERAKSPEVQAIWERLAEKLSDSAEKFSESFKALILCATPRVSPMGNV